MRIRYDFTVPSGHHDPTPVIQRQRQTGKIKERKGRKNIGENMEGNKDIDNHLLYLWSDLRSDFRSDFRSDLRRDLWPELQPDLRPDF